METKKLIYSLGIFKTDVARDRIVRRFAIIFILGGAITVVNNIIAGIPVANNLDIMFWTSIAGMLEKAYRTYKE